MIGPDIGSAANERGSLDSEGLRSITQRSMAAYQRDNAEAVLAQYSRSADRPRVVDAPRRRRPLRYGAQCESAAAALRVETPASLEVAVNELRVPAHRAEDSTRVGRAEKHGLLRRGRLHRP